MSKKKYFEIIIEIITLLNKKIYQYQFTFKFLKMKQKTEILF